MTYMAPWGDATVYRVDDVADLTPDGIMYFIEANGAVVSAPTRTGHRELGPLLASLAGPYGVDAARARRARTKLGWLRDAFGQPYRGWNSDADAAMWYLLRLLLAGALDVCLLDVDAAPGLDVARIDNQATLDRSLPPWCGAIVDQEQRNADCDGSMRIAPETAVHGLRINRWPWFGGSVPHHKRLRQFTAPIPLEIGHSNPTRTLVHLCQSTAVVRWPRDRPHVVLLSASPDIVDMTAQLETDLDWDDERGGDLGTRPIGQAVRAVRMPGTGNAARTLLAKDDSPATLGAEVRCPRVPRRCEAGLAQSSSC